MKKVYLYIAIPMIALLPALAGAVGIGDFFSALGVNYQLWNDVSQEGGSALIDDWAVKFETGYMVNSDWAIGYSAKTNLEGKLRSQGSVNDLNPYVQDVNEWSLASSTVIPSSPKVRSLRETGSQGNAPQGMALYDNYFARADHIMAGDPIFAVTTPEPATILLFGSGLLGAGVLARFRKRK